MDGAPTHVEVYLGRAEDVAGGKEGCLDALSQRERGVELPGPEAVE
jgi:hypothetical protein